ncbi:hypothetical protein [Jatrophihabitans lederbergiae]|uniref:Uncharacterized protein n=1 Tax=Jatrophihabitans lederbergiae TaxID=3075547 RepID=A0ABU2JDH7_9ACTN|nr:hypothetical protein [Jatrophihabitans sp. DSM 44399]MDT0263042.1 hypothetical protein [Jatrophihabitans sp. DSM 44399]
MTVLDDQPNDTLIELDARKRVSLPMAKPGRYLAHAEPDGTITLVPAVVMSKLEASILANSEIMAAVNRAEAAGYTGGRRDRPTRPTE